MRLLITGLLIGLLFCQQSNAQKNQPFNSGLIIQAGLKLHDEGNYKQAIEQYRQIPANDTNYTLALYELAYSQSADSNYDAAIATCRLGLQQDDQEHRLQFMVLLGSSIDDKGDARGAIRFLDTALRTYPQSQILALNKAVCYVRLKSYDTAAAIFQKLVLNNPYYGSAHFRLGHVALQQGKIIPAILCLYTYLLIDPNGSYASSAINLLVSISKVSDDVTRLIEERKEQPSSNTAMVEQILLSKISADPNYKALTDLDDPVIRQLQVVMEKLEYDSEDADFYHQYYVPYIKDVFDNKLFTPAVYYAFSSLDIEKIQKYIKKNDKQVKEALRLAGGHLEALGGTREINYAKRKNLPIIHHYSDRYLYAKGSMVNELQQGRWEFFYKNGNTTSFGEYKDGKKQGKWTYFYDDGQLSGVDNWVNGVQQGEDLIYNRYGVLVSKANFKDGKLEGEKTRYFAIGNPSSITTYRAGKEHGKYLEYYSSGALKIDAMIADDAFDGPYLKYFENGKKEVEARYEKGKLQGLYKSYHDNGQLEFELNYTTGAPNGLAKTYHSNGKLMRQMNYVDGLEEGEETMYDREGKLSQKSQYKKGKITGDSETFDDDGLRYSLFTYDNGKLKTAQYFDKSGKAISTSSRQGKQISLDFYTPEGFKVQSAVFNDAAEKQDKETYYYASGKVKEVNYYKDGQLNGISTGYYSNGKTEFEIEYKDGEKHGLSTFYHLNGKIKSQTWYNEGTLSGDHTEYNEQGHAVTRATYYDGDLSGQRHIYFPNGKIDIIETYRNGWLLGVIQHDTTGRQVSSFKLENGKGAYRTTYPNGNKRAEGNYVNSDLQGPFTLYFFDGSIETKKSYDRGYLHGEFTDYFYGGKVNYQGSYAHGKRTGTWKYYSEEGKLTREERYEDGELEGKTIHYYPDGKVEREYTYSEGLRQGAGKRFGQDGQLAYIIYYKDNQPVSYTYEDKTKTLLKPIPLPGGNGSLKAYYSNGNLSGEMSFTDGLASGSFKLYFPNGKIYYEEDSKINGLTNGSLKEYFPDGKLNASYNYVLDMQHGPYTEYYENGKIKEEGQTYNGYTVGTRKCYDENGKLKEQRQYQYGLILNIIK
ncbi:MAG TPA: tetratricopeptide repeat protein [Flavisolibacter sp.]|nr:tetratricopeptide repeat protein [Flavisolibacter sp.]